MLLNPQLSIQFREQANTYAQDLEILYARLPSHPKRFPKPKGLDFMKAEHKLHTMTDPKMFCACMQSDSLGVWVSSFLLCVIG